MRQEKSWLLRDVEASHCDNLGLPEQRSTRRVRRPARRLPSRRGAAREGNLRQELRRTSGDERGTIQNRPLLRCEGVKKSPQGFTGHTQKFDLRAQHLLYKFRSCR